MASSHAGMVDDLATLPELTESMLLEEIQARYQKGIIYTYIGDILLAVNPYKKLDIFSPEVLKMYTHVTMKSKLPPHIFAISDWSYVNMFRSGLNQCCVICGESGSGKTETTKLLIRHIVQICDLQTNGLLNRIIEINPLLEAFGNAKTVMNDNSSRFGKYIELQFDMDGKICGANVSDYLLEKSRVIQQAPGERNFHIFYYMFAGLDLKKLQINLLSKPDDHRILKPCDGSDVFGESGSFGQAVEMWKKTQQIMDLVGFSTDEKESITAMLTAVIHITDIRFLHDSDTDGSYIENEDRLEMAAILLGVEVDQLGAALTTSETTIPGQSEKIVILKNIYQAADGRDALAKTLYGRMFGWIVRQINRILGPGRSRLASQDVPGSMRMPSIGILDIYGFENFKTNSFEQLCINIANEQIHFYFTRHIFKMELDEYALEGIKGKNVQFDDNKHIVDLFFEANGLYDLLDEESKFPRANDLTLIEKLEKTFLKRPEFERPRTQNLQFVIQHYAGPVSYCISGFLEKNRDLLSVNVLDCMKKSESLFVADLFTASISDTGSLNDNDPRPPNNRRTVKSILLCKPLEKNGVKEESRTKNNNKKARRPTNDDNHGSVSKTLSGYFKNSLAKLLEKLISAEPHFVRCIRPNALKQPDTFNKELVLRQLRYTGVVQTVTIRRQGYATRLTFGDFLNRYKFIAFPYVSKVELGPNNCSRVLLQAGIEKFEIGKTKVILPQLLVISKFILIRKTFHSKDASKTL
jgi:myosin heavy subunit